MSSGMTETLPLTVFDVKGPIFIGERPALKLTGKVKWDNPFLKQVTDEGIGVAVDIVIFRLNAVVARFCAKRFSVPPRIPCNVYADDSFRVLKRHSFSLYDAISHEFILSSQIIGTIAKSLTQPYTSMNIKIKGKYSGSYRAYLQECTCICKLGLVAFSEQMAHHEWQHGVIL